MKEFNRKKVYRKFIYSPLVLFLLFLIFLLLLKALYGLYAKERISARHLENEQAEFGRVVARRDELAQAVEYLKTDKGLETEIRSKFRVVREGESVAVIIEEEQAAPIPTATTTEPSFWKKVLGLFGL